MRQRSRLIEEELKALAPQRGQVGRTRRTLHQKYPPVDLHIVPLSGAREVHRAIASLDVIEQLTITLVASNSEIDLDDFFKQFREESENLGAKRSSVDHRAAPGKSLGKEATEAEVKSASQQGQALVKVKGVDKNGAEVTQTNEDVRFRVEADFEATTPKGTAVEMHKALKSLLNAGVVKTGIVVHNVKAKSRKILDWWNKRDQR